MTPLLGEFIGTALLILLGDGVVANVVLRGTKGEGAGLIVIAWGWAMAVFVGVFAVARYSGAHLNPAVTVGLVTAGKFDAALAPGYILAQMAGAMLGAALVLLHYRPHFAVTVDPAAKLGVFSTGPAIRSTLDNLVSEVIGTFVLVFGVLYLATPDMGLGALDALPVGLLVLAIGVGLGGTTGYGINPARDLGPRIVHALLPIPGGKGSSDWGYSWIPVVGPMIGAVLAGLLYLALGLTTMPTPGVGV
jgi:glycerol uptake facilitator protein